MAPFFSMPTLRFTPASYVLLLIGLLACSPTVYGSDTQNLTLKCKYLSGVQLPGLWPMVVRGRRSDSKIIIDYPAGFSQLFSSSKNQSYYILNSSRYWRPIDVRKELTYALNANDLTLSLKFDVFNGDAELPEEASVVTYEVTGSCSISEKLRAD